MSEHDAWFWQDEARRYAQNVDFWREKAEHNAADARRMDWLAANLPFDGFGGRDVHEDTEQFLNADGTNEVEAYRAGLRYLIDRVMEQEAHDGK